MLLCYYYLLRSSRSHFLMLHQYESLGMIIFLFISTMVDNHQDITITIRTSFTEYNDKEHIIMHH